MAEKTKTEVLAARPSLMDEAAVGAAGAAGPSAGPSPAARISSRSVSPSAAAAAAAANKQAKRKASASPSPGEGAGKKKPKAPSVGAPTTAAAAPAATAAVRSPASNQAGPPTDTEIAAAIRERGPMASSALTAMFKARLAGADAKKAFTAAVKRVAKLVEQDGAKVIVLR